MIRLLIALLLPAAAFAMPNTSPTFPLWEGMPPNHKDSSLEEVWEQGEIIKVGKVRTPTIEVRLPSPKSATSKAVIICPGGGYSILAYDWEGTDIAGWLNAHGIAAIILKYRLPEEESNVQPHLSPLLDAERAVRLVRHRASEWNIDPNQIGVMGFSAGGHLASTLGTQFDAGEPEHADPVERHSSRPDFMILAYPVISFVNAGVRSGSERNLLGENAPQEMVTRYSNELHVTPDVPPTFLVHSSDDKGVPVKHSLLFYEALLENDVDVEMHLYPYGGHGYSLALGKGRLQNWSELCIDWINGLDL